MRLRASGRRPVRGVCRRTLAVLLAAAAVSPAAAAVEPWRLGEAVGAPAWLDLDGSFRLRYEGLSDHLRPGAGGSDQILVSRWLLALRLGGEDLYARFELEDSRAFLDDAETPLGSDDVNALEPLQAHLGFHLSDAFGDGDRVEVQAGRLTMDLGSRRLVARNRFRNTLNAFTGVHGAWKGAGEAAAEVRAFYLLPVDRRPRERDRLDGNEAELDSESTEVRFWGLHLGVPRLAGGMAGSVAGEVYVLRLDEDDRPSAPSRNRDLVTAGGRLLRAPARGAWDFEVEAALQRGESRRTTSSADTRDLDHEAWFAHLQAGYTFDATGAPRLVFQYDYASGDDDPADGENGRFDTLFGARRFEFGPTGIFGLLARSNVSSPGARLFVAPAAGRSWTVAYRAAWLASRHDALTTTGVGDPDGTDDFIGHLVEVRYRHGLVDGNLDLEVGAAHLVAGDLLSEPPLSLDDTTYGYLQTTFTF